MSWFLLPEVILCHFIAHMTLFCRIWWYIFVEVIIMSTACFGNKLLWTSFHMNYSSFDVFLDASQRNCSIYIQALLNIQAQKPDFVCLQKIGLHVSIHDFDTKTCKNWCTRVTSEQQGLFTYYVRISKHVPWWKCENYGSNTWRKNPVRHAKMHIWPAKKAVSAWNLSNSASNMHMPCLCR